MVVRVIILYLKRLIIISSLLVLIGVISSFSGENLWLNMPTEDEIYQRIDEKYRQDQQLLDTANSKDEEAYNDLFNNDVRHLFQVWFTQEEFDGLIDDMQTYNEMFGTYKSNNYRNVDITYYHDSEVTHIEDVGFRSKGHIYSRRLPVDELGNVREIHFMLKFNETFDFLEGTDEYNALKKREFANLEQILFKWNNTFDPSYSNEVFSYEMFKQIDVVVPEASFSEVQIFIDGKLELRSLYNIFEHYDEEFIRKHFDEGKNVGDLYKGQYSATLWPIDTPYLFGVRNWETNYRPLYSKETNKETDSYETLINFSHGINNENIELSKEYLEEHFDTDSFMRAMAMNVLLGNPDDYRGNGNNFYYYFDEKGYMTYLPFDYDNSIGSGWPAAEGFNAYTIGSDIYEWGFLPWNDFTIPLWDNLIYFEEYQLMYEDNLEQYIATGLYSVESYLEIYNKVEVLYGSDFVMSYDKTNYINTKIFDVLEDIDYYRNKRK